MENLNLTIEYKKFNSFLKDYIKNLNRGWIFLRMTKTYNTGTSLSFSFKVTDIGQELKANGSVVFSGTNTEGSKGVGIKLVFDEDTKSYLEKKIPKNIKEKYGEVWGGKICSLLEETEVGHK